MQPINLEKVRIVHLVTRCALNKSVQQIIALLQKGELSVTEIYTKLQVEQSVASQFLAKMKAHGMVNNRRESKKIYYSLNTEFFTQFNSFLNGWVK